MSSDTPLPQHPETLRQSLPALSNRETPFTFIAVMLLVAFITGAGGYWLGISKVRKSSAPTAQTVLPTPFAAATSIIQIQQQPSIAPNSPDAVLQTYYNSYLACQKDHFNNVYVRALNKSPQEDCPYNKIGVVTGELTNTLQQAKAYDPVLCAQNIPQEITYDKAVVTTTHATAIVHTVWGASPKQNITVGLDIKNGA